MIQVNHHSRDERSVAVPGDAYAAHSVGIDRDVLGSGPACCVWKIQQDAVGMSRGFTYRLDGMAESDFDAQVLAIAHGIDAL